ncbi:MAG: restriction endonuclease subunit S [Flavobacteriaceae bacterium]|nr:restriction endonuclease subunit S [Flavobacteriaceae bacterium]
MEKLVPRLRFPGFEGEWERKKLGDIAKFSKGKGISKAEIDSEGKLECVRYGELYTHYGETISDVKSKTNVPAENLVLSEANDVIIPASGETQLDIATASCVMRSGIALGGDLNIIRTDNNGVFLSYYLNYSKKQDIANLAQGISVVHLYASQLATLMLRLPLGDEQDKIADFISTIDTKLTHLKKKKTLLEQYKKGMMQKIFNRELRFKDYDGKEFGEWEEKTLGDIATKQSSNISANKIEENEGKYIIYGASGILKKVDFYKEENDYISIVKDGAGVGRLFYCEGYSSVLGTMDIIKPNEGINTYFVYCLLSNIDFKQYVSGSTIPHIYFKNYSSEIVGIPSLSEQIKIANFLSAIDKKITLVAQQIDGMEGWKKGVLGEVLV